jgi:hypothetical protein
VFLGVKLSKVYRYRYNYTLEDFFASIRHTKISPISGALKTTGNLSCGELR